LIQKKQGFLGPKACILPATIFRSLRR